jgi:hypothetical protein
VALSKALQALHEEESVGCGVVRRVAVEDRDRFEKATVLKEYAAIAGAEGMLRVRRDRESEVRKPRAGKRQRGGGQDEMIYRTDSGSPSQPKDADSFHGSIRPAPHPSKSAVSRVAMSALREMAIPAIIASNAFIGRPSLRLSTTMRE